MSKAPYLHLFSAGAHQAAIFGFQIPWLPDFLSDHTLLSEQPAAQLDEVLGRLTPFVVGLRRWPATAFALRYLGYPDQGRIGVAFLARTLAAPGQAAERAARLAAELQTHLDSFGLPNRPMAGPQESGLRLTDVLNPFSQPPAIVEIRQHETLLPMFGLSKVASAQATLAYVTYPFWGPAGAFLEPMESLLRQPESTVLSVYLEPTALSPQEDAVLLETAHQAETAADLQRSTESRRSISRLRDPAAERISRLYMAYHHSLEEPFVALIQVASVDSQCALAVARTVTAVLAAARSGQEGAGQERSLPSQAQALLAPPADLGRAQQTFASLIHAPWGVALPPGSSRPPGKERLPYLMGARGVATLFRFPISLRGGVPGIAVEQRPPDFETGPRQLEIAADELHLGNYRRGGAVAVKLKALTRHVLITGFTGTGKTNTMLYLLDQLWRKHRLPFLVIESAKKEYRALLNQQPAFADLLVFTLGNETAVPFRLNPFELLSGVRLESHIGRLQACFDAALPQFGILPSIIAESLERVYKEKGWELRTGRGGQKELPFPTMRDMFRVAVKVSEARGYSGELRDNIRAAVGGRLGSLLMGSRGNMFSVQRSYPMDLLLRRPVILELNELSPNDKALTMMFLLMLLREYRELHPGHTLQHVTVVEEAHNVMGNIKPTGPSEIAADTRGQAVQLFADLLTEVRAYGEGIFIADQSPEKLITDAIRNTNLQIAHQLRDAKDRETIGRALIMDRAQQDYLGKLAVGEAAVFQTGMEKATFMQVPSYKDMSGFDEQPTDEQVRSHMGAFLIQHLKAHLPFDGCRFCGSPCDYVDIMEPQTRRPERHEQFAQALLAFEQRPETEHHDDNWRGVAEACRTAAREAGRHELDAAYCFLAHEIDFPFTLHMRREFERAFDLVKG